MREKCFFRPTLLPQVFSWFQKTVVERIGNVSGNSFSRKPSSSCRHCVCRNDQKNRLKRTIRREAGGRTFYSFSTVFLTTCLPVRGGMARRWIPKEVPVGDTMMPLRIARRSVWWYASKTAFSPPAADERCFSFSSSPSSFSSFFSSPFTTASASLLPSCTPLFLPSLRVSCHWHLLFHTLQSYGTVIGIVTSHSCEKEGKETRHSTDVPFSFPPPSLPFRSSSRMMLEFQWCSFREEREIRWKRKDDISEVKHHTSAIIIYKGDEKTSTKWNDGWEDERNEREDYRRFPLAAFFLSPSSSFPFPCVKTLLPFACPRLPLHSSSPSSHERWWHTWQSCVLSSRVMLLHLLLVDASITPPSHARRGESMISHPYASSFLFESCGVSSYATWCEMYCRTHAQLSTQLPRQWEHLFQQWCQHYRPSRCPRCIGSLSMSASPARQEEQEDEMGEHHRRCDTGKGTALLSPWMSQALAQWIRTMEAEEVWTVAFLYGTSPVGRAQWYSNDHHHGQGKRGSPWTNRNTSSTTHAAGPHREDTRARSMRTRWSSLPPGQHAALSFISSHDSDGGIVARLLLPLSETLSPELPSSSSAFPTAKNLREKTKETMKCSTEERKNNNPARVDVTEWGKTVAFTIPAWIDGEEEAAPKTLVSSEAVRRRTTRECHRPEGHRQMDHARWALQWLQRMVERDVSDAILPSNRWQRSDVDAAGHYRMPSSSAASSSSLTTTMRWGVRAWELLSVLDEILCFGDIQEWLSRRAEEEEEKREGTKTHARAHQTMDARRRDRYLSHQRETKGCIDARAGTSLWKSEKERSAPVSYCCCLPLQLYGRYFYGSVEVPPSHHYTTKELFPDAIQDDAATTTTTPEAFFWRRMQCRCTVLNAVWHDQKHRISHTHPRSSPPHDDNTPHGIPSASAALAWASDLLSRWIRSSGDAFCALPPSFRCRSSHSLLPSSPSIRFGKERAAWQTTFSRSASSVLDAYWTQLFFIYESILVESVAVAAAVVVGTSLPFSSTHPKRIDKDANRTKENDVGMASKGLYHAAGVLFVLHRIISALSSPTTPSPPFSSASSSTATGRSARLPSPPTRRRSSGKEEEGHARGSSSLEARRTRMRYDVQPLLELQAQFSGGPSCRSRPYPSHTIRPPPPPPPPSSPQAVPRSRLSSPPPSLQDWHRHPHRRSDEERTVMRKGKAEAEEEEEGEEWWRWSTYWRRRVLDGQREGMTIPWVWWRTEMQQKKSSLPSVSFFTSFRAYAALWRELVRTDCVFLLSIGHASEKAEDLREWVEACGKISVGNAQRNGLMSKAVGTVEQCADANPHTTQEKQLPRKNGSEEENMHAGGREVERLAWLGEKSVTQVCHLFADVQQHVQVLQQLQTMHSASPLQSETIHEGRPHLAGRMPNRGVKWGSEEERQTDPHTREVRRDNDTEKRKKDENQCFLHFLAAHLSPGVITSLLTRAQEALRVSTKYFLVWCDLPSHSPVLSSSSSSSLLSQCQTRIRIFLSHPLSFSSSTSLLHSPHPPFMMAPPSYLCESMDVAILFGALQLWNASLYCCEALMAKKIVPPPCIASSLTTAGRTSSFSGTRTKPEKEKQKEKQRTQRIPNAVVDVEMKSESVAAVQAVHRLLHSMRFRDHLSQSIRGAAKELFVGLAECGNAHSTTTTFIRSFPFQREYHPPFFPEAKDVARCGVSACAPVPFHQEFHEAETHHDNDVSWWLRCWRQFVFEHIHGCRSVLPPAVVVDLAVEGALESGVQPYPEPHEGRAKREWTAGMTLVRHGRERDSRTGRDESWTSVGSDTSFASLPWAALLLSQYTHPFEREGKSTSTPLDSLPLSPKPLLSKTALRVLEAVTKDIFHCCCGASVSFPASVEWEAQKRRKTNAHDGNAKNHPEKWEKDETDIAICPSATPSHSISFPHPTTISVQTFLSYWSALLWCYPLLSPTLFTGITACWLIEEDNLNEKKRCFETSLFYRRLLQKTTTTTRTTAPNDVDGASRTVAKGHDGEETVKFRSPSSSSSSSTSSSSSSSSSHSILSLHQKSWAWRREMLARLEAEEKKKKRSRRPVQPLDRPITGTAPPALQENGMKDEKAEGVASPAPSAAAFSRFYAHFRYYMEEHLLEWLAVLYQQSAVAATSEPSLSASQECLPSPAFSSVSPSSALPVLSGRWQWDCFLFATEKQSDERQGGKEEGNPQKMEAVTLASSFLRSLSLPLQYRLQEVLWHHRGQRGRRKDHVNTKNLTQEEKVEGEGGKGAAHISCLLDVHAPSSSSCSSFSFPPSSSFSWTLACAEQDREKVGKSTFSLSSSLWNSVMWRTISTALAAPPLSPCPLRSSSSSSSSSLYPSSFASTVEAARVLFTSLQQEANVLWHEWCVTRRRREEEKEYIKMLPQTYLRVHGRGVGEKYNVSVEHDGGRSRPSPFHTMTEEEKARRGVCSILTFPMLPHTLPVLRYHPANVLQASLPSFSSVSQMSPRATAIDEPCPVQDSGHPRHSSSPSPTPLQNKEPHENPLQEGIPKRSGGAKSISQWKKIQRRREEKKWAFIQRLHEVRFLLEEYPEQTMTTSSSSSSPQSDAKGIRDIPSGAVGRLDSSSSSSSLPPPPLPLHSHHARPWCCPSCGYWNAGRVDHTNPSSASQSRQRGNGSAVQDGEVEDVRPSAFPRLVGKAMTSASSGGTVHCGGCACCGSERGGWLWCRTCTQLTSIPRTLWEWKAIALTQLLQLREQLYAPEEEEVDAYDTNTDEEEEEVEKEEGEEEDSRFSLHTNFVGKEGLSISCWCCAAELCRVLPTVSGDDEKVATTPFPHTQEEGKDDPLERSEAAKERRAWKNGTEGSVCKEDAEGSAPPWRRHTRGSPPSSATASETRRPAFPVGDGIYMVIHATQVARLWWWHTWRCTTCHALQYPSCLPSSSSPSVFASTFSPWLPPPFWCASCGALPALPPGALPRQLRYDDPSFTIRRDDGTSFPHAHGRPGNPKDAPKHITSPPTPSAPQWPGEHSPPSSASPLLLDSVGWECLPRASDDRQRQAWTVGVGQEAVADWHPTAPPPPPSSSVACVPSCHAAFHENDTAKKKEKEENKEKEGIPKGILPTLTPPSIAVVRDSPASRRAMTHRTRPLHCIVCGMAPPGSGGGDSWGTSTRKSMPWMQKSGQSTHPAPTEHDACAIPPSSSSPSYMVQEAPCGMEGDIQEAGEAGGNAGWSSHHASPRPYCVFCGALQWSWSHRQYHLDRSGHSTTDGDTSTVSTTVEGKNTILPMESPTCRRRRLDRLCLVGTLWVCEECDTAHPWYVSRCPVCGTSLLDTLIRRRWWTTVQHRHAPLSSGVSVSSLPLGRMTSTAATSFGRKVEKEEGVEEKKKQKEEAAHDAQQNRRITPSTDDWLPYVTSPASSLPSCPSWCECCGARRQCIQRRCWRCGTAHALTTPLCGGASTLFLVTHASCTTAKDASLASSSSFFSHHKSVQRQVERVKKEEEEEEEGIQCPPRWASSSPVNHATPPSWTWFPPRVSTVMVPGVFAGPSPPPTMTMAIVRLSRLDPPGPPASLERREWMHPEDGGGGRRFPSFFPPWSCVRDAILYLPLHENMPHGLRTQMMMRRMGPEGGKKKEEGWKDPSLDRPTTSEWETPAWQNHEKEAKKKKKADGRDGENDFSSQEPDASSWRSWWRMVRTRMLENESTWWHGTRPSVVSSLPSCPPWNARTHQNVSFFSSSLGAFEESRRVACLWLFLASPSLDVRPLALPFLSEKVGRNGSAAACPSPRGLFVTSRDHHECNGKTKETDAVDTMSTVERNDSSRGRRRRPSRTVKEGDGEQETYYVLGSPPSSGITAVVQQAVLVQRMQAHAWKRTRDGSSLLSFSAFPSREGAMERTYTPQRDVGGAEKSTEKAVPEETSSSSSPPPPPSTMRRWGVAACTHPSHPNDTHRTAERKGEDNVEEAEAKEKEEMPTLPCMLLPSLSSPFLATLLHQARQHSGTTMTHCRYKESHPRPSHPADDACSDHFSSPFFASSFTPSCLPISLVGLYAMEEMRRLLERLCGIANTSASSFSSSDTREWVGATHGEDEEHSFFLSCDALPLLPRFFSIARELSAWLEVLTHPTFPKDALPWRSGAEGEKVAQETILPSTACGASFSSCQWSLAKEILTRMIDVLILLRHWEQKEGRRHKKKVDRKSQQDTTTKAMGSTATHTSTSTPALSSSSWCGENGRIPSASTCESSLPCFPCSYASLWALRCYWFGVTLSWMELLRCHSPFPLDDLGFEMLSRVAVEVYYYYHYPPHHPQPNRKKITPPCSPAAIGALQADTEDEWRWRVAKRGEKKRSNELDWERKSGSPNGAPQRKWRTRKETEMSGEGVNYFAPPASSSSTSSVSPSFLTLHRYTQALRYAYLLSFRLSAEEMLATAAASACSLPYRVGASPMTDTEHIYGESSTVRSSPISPPSSSLLPPPPQQSTNERTLVFPTSPSFLSNRQRRKKRR